MTECVCIWSLYPPIVWIMILYKRTYLKAANQEKPKYGEKPDKERQHVEQLQFSGAVRVVTLDVTVADPYNHKCCTVSHARRENF